MKDWELYSEIDEKGRFPKKIKKEYEDERYRIEEEWEEMYWREQERDCRMSIADKIAENYGNTQHTAGEYDCNELEPY